MLFFPPLAIIIYAKMNYLGIFLFSMRLIDVKKMLAGKKKVVFK